MVEKGLSDDFQRALGVVVPCIIAVLLTARHGIAQRPAQLLMAKRFCVPLDLFYLFGLAAAFLLQHRIEHIKRQLGAALQNVVHFPDGLCSVRAVV